MNTRSSMLRPPTKLSDLNEKYGKANSVACAVVTDWIARSKDRLRGKQRQRLMVQSKLPFIPDEMRAEEIKSELDRKVKSEEIKSELDRKVKSEDALGMVVLGLPSSPIVTKVDELSKVEVNDIISIVDKL